MSIENVENNGSSNPEAGFSPEAQDSLKKGGNINDAVARLEAKVLLSLSETEKLLEDKVIEHDQLQLRLKDVEALNSNAQANYDKLKKLQELSPDDQEVKDLLERVEGDLIELAGQRRDIEGRLTGIKAVPEVAEKITARAQAKRDKEQKEYEEFFAEVKKKILVKADELAQKIFALGLEMIRIYSENGQQGKKHQDADRAVLDICHQVNRQLGPKNKVPELQAFLKHRNADNAEVLLSAVEGIKTGIFSNRGLKQLSSAETKSALQSFIDETKKYEETEKKANYSQSDKFTNSIDEDVRHLIVDSVTDDEYKQLRGYEKSNYRGRYELMRDMQAYLQSAVDKLIKQAETQKSMPDRGGWNPWSSIVNGTRNGILSSMYSNFEDIKRREKTEN